MQIASTRSGESLEQLASRVYSFSKQPSKTRLRTAATALTDANPFLRRATQIPPGVQVIVPALEGAEPAVDTAPADAVTAGAFLDRLDSLIGQTTSSLLGDVDSDVSETKDSIETMRSQRLVRLARERGLTDDLHTARAAAKQRTADAAELQRQLGRMGDQIAKDLAEMRATLGP